MKGVKICFPEKFHSMKIGHQIQFTGKIQIFAPNIDSLHFDEIFRLVKIEQIIHYFESLCVLYVFPLHFHEIFLTVGVGQHFARILVFTKLVFGHDNNFLPSHITSASFGSDATAIDARFSTHGNRAWILVIKMRCVFMGFPTILTVPFSSFVAIIGDSQFEIFSFAGMRVIRLQFQARNDVHRIGL